MKKTLFLSLSLAFAFLLLPLASNADTLGDRLKGRILLQVESRGEAWYVNPDDRLRYYLSRPADAFKLMRDLGLGISNADFNRYMNNAPQNLLGKIVIKVHDKGQAYYVDPVAKKMHYLGRPADAFKVMREHGLGISNSDLDRIAANKAYSTSPFSRHVITVSDNSASPNEITVKAGSEVEIELRALSYGLARDGVELRASNGMGVGRVLYQGESKIVSFNANKPFNLVPYYPESNIKLPYIISINVK